MISKITPFQYLYEENHEEFEPHVLHTDIRYLPKSNQLSSFTALWDSVISFLGDTVFSGKLADAWFDICLSNISDKLKVLSKEFHRQRFQPVVLARRRSLYSTGNSGCFGRLREMRICGFHSSHLPPEKCFMRIHPIVVFVDHLKNLLNDCKLSSLISSR